MIIMSSRRPRSPISRAVVRPHAHGSSEIRADVAGAVADQRQRLLGERREHELAFGARREGTAVRGIDDLDEEVVLLDVEAVARRSTHSVATPGPHISDSP